MSLSCCQAAWAGSRVGTARQELSSSQPSSNPGLVTSVSQVVRISTKSGANSRFRRAYSSTLPPRWTRCCAGGRVLREPTSREPGWWPGRRRPVPRAGARVRFKFGSRSRGGARVRLVDRLWTGRYCRLGRFGGWRLPYGVLAAARHGAEQQYRNDHRDAGRQESADRPHSVHQIGHTLGDQRQLGTPNPRQTTSRVRTTPPTATTRRLTPTTESKNRGRDHLDSLSGPPHELRTTQPPQRRLHAHHQSTRRVLDHPHSPTQPAYSDQSQT